MSPHFRNTVLNWRFWIASPLLLVLILMLLPALLSGDWLEDWVEDLIDWIEGG